VNYSGAMAFMPEPRITAAGDAPLCLRLP
jgi:hypothetical protein